MHTLKHTEGSHNHTLKKFRAKSTEVSQGVFVQSNRLTLANAYIHCQNPPFSTAMAAAHTHTHTLTEAASRTPWPGCCYANSCAKVKSSKLKQIMFKWIDLFSNTLLFLFRTWKVFDSECLFYYIINVLPAWYNFITFLLKVIRSIDLAPAKARIETVLINYYLLSNHA